MAYRMYMSGVLMPLTPSKVTVKINNQNETLTLINGNEINLLKSAGLSDVSFELCLPHTKYPFCNGVVLPISVYLALFERLKTSKSPFQWILIRSKPNGSLMRFSNMTVSLESYEMVDDTDEGLDAKVKIELKQYRPHGTKSVIVTTAADGTAVAAVQAAARSTASAPSLTSYVTKAGDTLWNIAKQTLGDGSKYTELLSSNKSILSSATDVAAGLTLTLPT